MLQFTIDAATPTLNEWQRMHFMERRRKTLALAWLVRVAVGRWERPPIKQCVVYIERHNSGRLPDWDGLYGGLKPLLDSMVKCTKINPHGLGIIEDDSPRVISRLIAVPVKSRVKQTVVRIYMGAEIVRIPVKRGMETCFIPVVTHET